MAITRLLLAFTLLLMLAPPIVHAQDRESFRSREGGRDEGGERGGRGGGERGRGEWGGRGGGERGGEGRGGFGRGGRRDPTAFLQRLDANGDGIIDPSEIPERMRPFMDRIGERMGFDPTKPISLKDLQRQSEQNNQSRDDNDSKPSDSTDKPQSEPLVPGFGVTIELPTVPGFDIAMTSGSGTSENGDQNDERSRDEEGRTDDNQSSRDSSSSESSPSLSPQQVDARYRRFAESMLQRYDTNGDGKLQKEEWSQMRGEPELADANGDGIITLDELVSHAGASSSGGSSSAGSSSSSADNAPRSTSTGKRFMTPAERLPAGLPDWFLRNDQDGDGQIMMHEFTSEWSEAKAAEFARYDLNGDGIIVPSEALQGGQSSTASRSSSSSDARSESRDSSSSRDGSSFGSRSSSEGRDSWRSESRDSSSRFGSGRDSSRSFGGNRRSR